MVLSIFCRARRIWTPFGAYVSNEVWLDYLEFEKDYKDGTKHNETDGYYEGPSSFEPNIE